MVVKAGSSSDWGQAAIAGCDRDLLRHGTAVEAGSEFVSNLVMATRLHRSTVSDQWEHALGLQSGISIFIKEDATGERNI